ncbi:phosphonate ABC transporter ATP-binding protein [Mobilicoccus massiliensis]|uniref:phosphonate ABC transporter ATP-binding protein n=1 Tax=Mobilicoccus massiliensis TaxID=1522310 RepID=UPI000590DE30|nr:phosphonate ABC transporter ATP-binding protein [Mobilicoccus massiliensis]
MAAAPQDRSAEQGTTPVGYPEVRLEHVTKDFGGTLGLDDVSIGFDAERVTILLGLSGSGKSTLLRHINGLQQPTSGRIFVSGESIERASGRQLKALRRDIGFIFQHFHLVGSMSVLENVCTGRLGALRGPRLSLMSYPKSLRQEAYEQLDRVGLASRAYQRADTLSGGQQQRVAIARALVQRPKILLADEPVASLDPVSAAQVMELIGQISREEHLTVICSLHQVQTALTYGDRIVGLRAGRVVLDRATSEIGQQEALRIYDSVAATEPVETRV